MLTKKQIDIKIDIIYRAQELYYWIMNDFNLIENGIELKACHLKMN